MKISGIILVVFSGTLLLAGAAVAKDTGGNTFAKTVLKSVDRKDGLCVLAGIADPEIAIELAKNAKFLIHIVHKDADVVASMRKAIDAQELYGRISVSHARFEGGHLPYAENIVNLLIVDKSFSQDEAMRVLAPYGTAYLDGRKVVKPYPKNMDEWTHFRHTAEGNMVAEDTVVGIPRHVRWITGPDFHRSHALTPGITVMVGTKSRIFYIQDDAPMGFAGLPDQWNLIARDAFNGKLLWKKPITPWGDPAWSWWVGGHGSRGNHPYHVNKRLVADGDRVFVTLGYNRPVAALDAATGKLLIEYKGTAFADEIIYRNGALFISVNDREQKPHPGKGFNVKPTSLNISKKTVWALDPATGVVKWKSGPYTGISGTSDRMSSMKQLMMIASDKALYVIAGPEELVGVDIKDGKELFRTTIGKMSSKASFVHHKGVLLLGHKGTLRAFDAQTGKEKWQGKQFSGITTIEVPELFAIGDLVWNGGAKSMVLQAYDLNTGKVVRKHSLKDVLVNAGHHHRCYPNKATSKYLITGRRAAEFTDFKTGEVTVNHWARGMCRYGLMPANGLLYKPSDPCSCHITGKLIGFYALASTESARDFFKDSPPSEGLLEKGKAFGKIADEKFSSASQWPTFRHDILRSSSVKTSVPSDVRKLWDVKIGGNLTPPVIAHGRVYVSSIDRHSVYAFNEKTGDKLWTYIAGGRVDSPPTIYDGMAVFGATDGWIYCLRASDGALAWRFRAAPYDRNIMAYNKVESAWPVHGSVFVSNGVAYCAAGRSVFVDGGIYLYALDLARSKIGRAHV